MSARVLDWHGLLAIDKPSGVTSHDVVERVRRRLGSPGAGHLGTLDPGATGLLVVALGAATRAISAWQGGEKTYEGSCRFGRITSTQDLQGDVLETRDASTLDPDAVRAATGAFRGAIEQVPPMVSAIKVGGRRLHALARRGIEVERAARPVEVRSWEWLGFELPEGHFRIRCSGGTYVRTLVHDLGLALGTGAALSRLHRVRSEPFGLERSVTMRQLDDLDAASVIERCGIPLDRALDVLPGIALDEAAAVAIGAGGRPSVDPLDRPLAAGPRSVVLRDREGRALGLGELAPDPASPGRALACPNVVFPWAVRTGRERSGPAERSVRTVAGEFHEL